MALEHIDNLFPYLVERFELLGIGEIYINHGIYVVINFADKNNIYTHIITNHIYITQVEEIVLESVNGSWWRVLVLDGSRYSKVH